MCETHLLIALIGSPYWMRRSDIYSLLYSKEGINDIYVTTARNCEMLKMIYQIMKLLLVSKLIRTIMSVNAQNTPLACEQMV